MAWCFDDSVRVFAELAYIRSDCGSVGNKIILLRLFFTLKRDPVCLRELSLWSENVDVKNSNCLHPKVRFSKSNYNFEIL